MKRRNFIHVADIASGILRSIQLTGFNIINLAGSEFVTLERIVGLSEKIVGKKAEVVESGESPSMRKISIEKAKKLLGWSPSLDIESGLRSLGMR